MITKDEYKIKDVIYAGFAQFCYLDWHKLDNNSRDLKLNNVFGRDLKYFNQIKTQDYEDLMIVLGRRIFAP